MKNWFSTGGPALALLLIVAACGSAADDGRSPADGEIPGQEAAEPVDTDDGTDGGTESGTATDAPIYLDPSSPIEDRVGDLLDRMTLEQKIGQMTLVENGSITPEVVRQLGIGAVLTGGNGGPDAGNLPADWASMVAEYQEAALAAEPAIPLLYGIDAVHGHNNVRGATVFPHNIGLGATGDAELVREIGRVTAVETLATGIHWNFAPVVAVPQDIRWGRTYEAYAERTDLVTELSTAFLLGLQSTGPIGDGTRGQTDLSDPLTMLATPKHFVGDGATSWDPGSGNYPIDQGDAAIGEEELRAIHLPPYPAAIDAGAMSIMASFSSWEGTKMHAQEYLLTDVLKGELGFDGFIVSDWQAIDQINPDFYTSVVTAINAGIDMNMVPSNYEGFIAAMNRGVVEGTITEDRIDDAVRRILAVKFRLGLFERPFVEPDRLDLLGADDHRDLARRAVRESLVLLQNRNGILPLADDLDTVFVAGLGGNDIGIQSGGWTLGWQGTGGSNPPGTTILEGIEAAVGSNTDVFFNRFGDFDRRVDENGALLRADVGIVVVGEKPYAEGVGDSDDLVLDPTVVERVAERSDHVVVIVVSGRPLVLTEALPLADAWVAAWLPGTEGGGVADVLFGDHPFAGTSTFSWPRSMDQIPFDFEALSAEGCDAPLFAYGYGLSADDTEPVAVPDCPG